MTLEVVLSPPGRFITTALTHIVSLFLEESSHDFISPEYSSFIELAEYRGILSFGNEQWPSDLIEGNYGPIFHKLFLVGLSDRQPTLRVKQIC